MSFPNADNAETKIKFQEMMKKYWNEFHCEEKEFADEQDGHTEKDVIARLMKCNNQNY